MLSLLPDNKRSSDTLPWDLLARLWPVPDRAADTELPLLPDRTQYLDNTCIRTIVALAVVPRMAESRSTAPALSAVAIWLTLVLWFICRAADPEAKLCARQVQIREGGAHKGLKHALFKFVLYEDRSVLPPGGCVPSLAANDPHFRKSGE